MFNYRTDVQQWNDTFGTGYNVSQATTANQPLYASANAQYNFNPSVDFRNADFLDNPTALLASDSAGAVSGLEDMVGFSGTTTDRDEPVLGLNSTGFYYSHTGSNPTTVVIAATRVAGRTFRGAASWIDDATDDVQLHPDGRIETTTAESPSVGVGLRVGS
ncbi:MAG: hypothetical protein DCC55_24790 [Chloroflexi bacterium]|nr:MAG: hypothetical protein DCC55_24790 [Chloroflexota bacterium]